MLKSFFLIRKSANAILRAKLNYMKMFFLMRMNCFLQQKTDFMGLSFFAEEVI